MLKRGMLGLRPVGRVFHPAASGVRTPAAVRGFLVGAAAASVVMLAALGAANVAFTVEAVRLAVDALFGWLY